MKHYYFYFDEGGMIGGATIGIYIVKLNHTEEELENDFRTNIQNYYFGILPISSIIRHIQLFKETFHNCNIKYTEDSDIKDLGIKLQQA